MKGAIYDVAVIGGGLHGLSAAMFLARAGKRVVVLERAWVGRHSSGASAAGVRTLGRDLRELDLSLESMDMWHGITALVGDECGFRAEGTIRVTETETDLAKLEERVVRLNSMGYRHEEIIDAHELQRLAPSINSHFLGGAISRHDGSADPHRTIVAFRRAAEEAGVEIREGCGVYHIERQGQDWSIQIQRSAYLGRSRNPERGEGSKNAGTLVVPTIVNAAGAWGGQVAAMVGDNIPLGTKASMMIVTERLTPMVRPVLSIMGRSISFKQTDQGTLVIGGGLQGVPDLDAESSAVRLGVLSQGARAANDLFPCVRDIRIVRVWAGLEAKTSDMLPVVGPSANAPGVYHAFGYSGHGFQLVPVVGAALADLITRGTTQRAIGALNPERLMALPATKVL